MGSDRCEISVKFDQRHKINCRNAENANLKWKELYGFLPGLYKYGFIHLEYNKIIFKYNFRDLHEKLNVITGPDTKKSNDERKIHIPLNVNGFYGLLSTKKEFRLECFGPDVEKFPLPKEEFI